MASNQGQKKASGQPTKYRRFNCKMSVNHHKPSNSKYESHHVTSEYPKKFWDSSSRGTLRYKDEN